MKLKKAGIAVLSSMLAVSNTAGTLLYATEIPTPQKQTAQVQALPSAENTGGIKDQFMNGVEPMPIIENLSSSAWGADTVGARDQKNGLEDPTLENYSYWGGRILKDEQSGHYYMFASRWAADQGYAGRSSSKVIVATSNDINGPYSDQGELMPDFANGYGDYAAPFEISEKDPLYGEGYRYGVVLSGSRNNADEINGSLHVAKTLGGSWEHIGKLNNPDGKLALSGLSIMVRADGTYGVMNGDGYVATARTLAGQWTTVNEKGWSAIPSLSEGNCSDPVVWYEDGLYHCLVSHEMTSGEAYACRGFHLVSADGMNDWRMPGGSAWNVGQNYLTYTNGTLNKWAVQKSAGVYMEEGRVSALTLSVSNARLENDGGNDANGTKVIVVPFNDNGLKEYALNQEETQYNERRSGRPAKEDAAVHSWQSEVDENYNHQENIMIQGAAGGNGVLGEGERPSADYDCKVLYLKYDLQGYLVHEGADAIASALLNVIYKGYETKNANTFTLKAAIAGNAWNEKDLTWNKQPGIPEDALTAQSDVYSLNDREQQVTIDITEMVKAFVAENPDAIEMTIALTETSGSKIFVGSKESDPYMNGAMLDIRKEGRAPWKYSASPNDITLEAGAKQTVSVEFTNPADPVNAAFDYFSSNPEVVTVDENGEITARNPGDAFIRIRSLASGSSCYMVVHVPKDEQTREPVEISTVNLTTAEGFDAVLPRTVDVIWSDGSTSAENVEWNLDGADLSHTGTVSGKLSGTSFGVNANITAHPAGMTYIIDCNNPDSPWYKQTDAYADLYNEVPDKVASDGTWGALEEYGKQDGNAGDSYDPGIWAPNGHSIDYRIPLEDGKYHIEFAFKEWWPDSVKDRPMDISGTWNGESHFLGKGNTWKSSWENWNKVGFDIDVTNGSDAVFTVSKPDDASNWPMLSYIAINRILNTEELAGAIAKVQAADLAGADAQKTKELYELCQNATASLVRAATTQTVVDTYTKDILALLSELDGETQPEWTIDRLQELIDEQTASMPDAFFEESAYAAYQSALESAKALIDQASTEEKAIQEACAALEQAFEKLAEAALDTAELEALINEAQNKNSEDYTHASWQSLEDALSAADALLAKGHGSAQDLSKAAGDLADAIARLQELADKSALQALYDDGLKLEESAYTKASWAAFANAMNEAKTVLDHENAAQSEVDQAEDKLSQAKEALVALGDKAALLALIEEAEALDEGEYTPNSWSAMQSALAAAKEVADNADASQKEIDDACAALESAIDALTARADKSALKQLYTDTQFYKEKDFLADGWKVFKEVRAEVKAMLDDANAEQADVDELTERFQNAIDGLVRKADKKALLALHVQAQKLVESDYMSGWDAFVEARAHAQTVLNNQNATQAEVDAEVEALQAAMDALIAKPDKTNLGKLIEEAEKLDPADYISTGWSAFEEALAQAKAVFEDQGVGEEEVGEMITTLTNAMNALIEKADKTALQELYDELSQFVEEDYTPSTWNPFAKVLEEAGTILENEDALQADVDEALTNLEDARDALAQAADKSALNEAIEKAMAFDETKYTPASWSELLGALAQAKAVADNPEADQSAVDEAAGKLDQAIEQLAARADKSELEKLYTDTLAYEENDFLADGWKAFDSMRDEVKAMLDDADAAQADVDELTEKFQSAIDGLVRKADKGALEDLYDLAFAKDEEQYTPSSWLVLADAMDRAKEILDDSDALQADVDRAYADLENALEALAERADNSALQALFDRMKDVLEEDYEATGWEDFARARENARAILDNADASAEEIERAGKALQDAFDALIAKVEIDTAMLDMLIGRCESIDRSEYSTKDWSKFDEALQTAKEARVDLVSQEVIDAAMTALHYEYLNLRLIPSEDKLKQLLGIL